LNALPVPTQEDLDAGLERVIKSVRMFAVNVAASDPQLSREMFAIMAALIEKRSVEQIQKMEASLPEPWRS
jgi:hypothetical protein